MKLIGKCKEEFLDYYWENYIKSIGVIGAKFETEEFFNSLYPTFQQSLIIEFFDSVGIWENIFYYEYRKTKFQDHKEAINKSIIKANEIYNSK